MSVVLKNGKLHTFNIHIPELILIILFALSVYTPGAAIQNDKSWIIVLDPGHGGNDPGALGSMSREKDITLAIALKTGTYIEQNIKNARVIYTRQTDTFVELRDRPVIANKNKADLFISIHANWAKQKSVRGFETYVMGVAKDQQNLEVAMKENEVILLENDHSTKYEGFDPNSEVSYVMFSLTQKVYQEQSLDLASKIEAEFRERVDRNDRDIKQAGFWVLYTTAMPSVLVETGFITNITEEKFLNSPAGQDYLASAIARACSNYINEIESKSIKLSDLSKVTQSPEISQQPPDTAPGKTIFMVQIATSSSHTELKADNFKGLGDVAEIKAQEIFKYASGRFTDYSSAVRYRKKLEAIYPDAFVIAVKDNKLLPLQQAIEQAKAFKKK